LNLANELLGDCALWVEMWEEGKRSSSLNPRRYDDAKHRVLNNLLNSEVKDYIEEAYLTYLRLCTDQDPELFEELVQNPHFQRGFDQQHWQVLSGRLYLKPRWRRPQEGGPRAWLKARLLDDPRPGVLPPKTPA
jgi:hypothetical protein